MKVTQDILDQYDHEPINRSRYHIPITIMFGIFLCTLILDMFINIENLTWKGFNPDWVDILLSALLPGCGLIFFIAKKRIGWFISTIFFSFIAFAAIATIIYTIKSRADFSYLYTLKGRQIFILASTITLSTLLQTKSIRVSFQVGNPLWFVAMLISLCLASGLILFGY